MNSGGVMKDFLVLSDGAPDDEARFACAEALARRFEGFVSAVVAAELPAIPAMVAAEPAGFIPPDDGLRQAAIERANQVKAKVARRFANHASPVPVFQVTEMPEFLGAGVASLARTSDLFVTTLPADGSESPILDSVLDELLLDGCCGVLGLPLGLTCDASFPTITVAWNHSREASRAVARAMPLIQQARSVNVVLVDQPLRRAGDARRPSDDVIDHLKHHGISASLSRVAREQLRTSEAILAEAGRMGSDLLVMGAPAEGGLLQWFRGSVSREVLAASSVPLFMAH
ncbi:MAG: universal stress protein [Xanthobacteraceae bacterium]